MTRSFSPRGRPEGEQRSPRHRRRPAATSLSLGIVRSSRAKAESDTASTLGERELRRTLRGGEQCSCRSAAWPHGAHRATTCAPAPALLRSVRRAVQSAQQCERCSRAAAEVTRRAHAARTDRCRLASYAQLQLDSSRVRSDCSGRRARCRKVDHLEGSESRGRRNEHRLRRCEATASSFDGLVACVAAHRSSLRG